MKLTEREVGAAYECYGHLVLRRCRAILRDDDLAQDALQEVFVRLMRYGGKFKQADSPLRWLYRVSDRVCFDLIKATKRQPESRESTVQQRSDASRPDQAVADRQAVLRFLAHFDDKTKQIAILHYVEELPQERIAQETGWSRQTIHKKLQRLRAKAAVLRRSLGVT